MSLDLDLTVLADGRATHLGRFSREEMLLLDPTRDGTHSTVEFDGSLSSVGTNRHQLEAEALCGLLDVDVSAGTVDTSISRDSTL